MEDKALLKHLMETIVEDELVFNELMDESDLVLEIHDYFINEIKKLTEFNKNVLQQICLNIAKDDFRGKVGVLIEWLKDLREGGFKESVNKSYTEFCYSNTLQGKLINYQDQILGHVKPRSKFKKFIEEINNELIPKDDFEDQLNDVLINEESDEERRDIAKKALQDILDNAEKGAINHPDYLQWSTFNEFHPDDCPFDQYEYSSEIISDKLGLPKNETESDDPLIIFTFKLSPGDEQRSIHKPTFLDANWNGFWRANPEEDFGRTFTHDTQEKGFPEVVHKSTKFMELETAPRLAI